LKNFEILLNPDEGFRIMLEIVRRNVVLTYFIASTKTSTVPGISIAGASPSETLYTPALDVEYLVYGAPRTKQVIPVTPEGLPTPAIITRVAASILGEPLVVVDAGSYVEPAVPRIDLPSKRVGGRIDVEPALPRGCSEKLFDEARTLSKMMLPRGCAIVVGESMPGGTTTAMAIMEGLGYRAKDRVSSASPNNPLELKWQVVSKALSRLSSSETHDVFEVVDEVGDPLHVSIAGYVSGALEKDCVAVLAGGTQMCAVLAILKRLGIDYEKRLAIWTTKWIALDKQSDIVGLVKDIDERVPLVAAWLDFSKSRYRGLRMYEEGYVKEGVGAGGTALTVMLRRGLSVDELVEEIEREYRRLVEAKAVKAFESE